MFNANRKLRVFLCHASQDKPIVRELYQRLLTEEWIEPWLDEEKLLPGQDWDMEIEKAVEAADVVIVFLSSYSVSKDGYVQKEIRFALNVALFKPHETIFIVPLRLDECLVPRNFSSIQYIDFFPSERFNWAYQRLHQSLDFRLKQIARREAIVLELTSPDQQLTQIEANTQTLTPDDSSLDAEVDKSALPIKKIVKKKTGVNQPVKKRGNTKVETKKFHNQDSQENEYSQRTLDLLISAQANLRSGRLTPALESYNALAQKGVYLGIIVVTLEKIVKDYPDYQLAWETLGYAYKGLEQNDNARQAFQKAK